MSKEMVVSVNGREKKIAILENGRVTEFYIERGEENSGVVGNVYKGRVMRVLPGMQSAFVDIGLERDAFLYVSDFFDEEEEIERIVMEKSKKGSPDEAKREADERIDRARIEREKQMEAVQAIAEPFEEIGAPIHEIVPEPAPEKPKRGRGRGSRSRSSETEKRADETETHHEDVGRREEKDRSYEDRPHEDRVPEDRPYIEPTPTFAIEFDSAGFERISDDEEATDVFKDAYVQEAIVDRVRAVEFDMESAAEAEVGSVMADAAQQSSGFQRIADEDDDTAQPATGRGRGKTAKSSKAADKPSKEKTTAKRSTAAKSKATGRSKRSKTGTDESGDETLQDAEASVKEQDEIAEMAVRRGGRGRRRGGKPKGKSSSADGGSGESDESDDAIGEDIGENMDVTADGADGIEEHEEIEEAPVIKVEHVPEPTGNGEEPRPDDRPDRDRGRGGRGRGGRGRGERQPADSKRFERNDRRDRPPQPAISDLLREGQEILVQIAKEPIAKKGARITSHIAMPGRYLVYMPTIEHLGVSRKIESANERARLRTLISRIRQDDTIPSGGFIVRTAGTGISEEDLRNDAKFLVRTWVEAKKNSEKKKSPALVHQDLDLVQRLLRDQLSDDFTAIRVDSEDEYLRTVEFMNRVAPRMVNRVKLYTRDEPILDSYGVQEEIDKALKPRVWLKSGGYLVINQTEALVAIDVNTGKFVGKGNARLEDTITRTNMEAVDEIARQIRLRDLGGIIVLDLIDMEDRRNRHKVSQALQEALASDRSPTKVLSFNDFGLIIMTRKRVKQSLERTMCAPCEYCEGSGWVKSPTTVCYEILAEARRLSKNVEDVRHTTLRVHPDVANAMRNSEREVMELIEAYLGNVDLTSDKSIHQAQFDFAFV